MRIICVDDEKLILDMTVIMCKELPECDEAEGFTSPQKALESLVEKPAQVALLDIDMPGMNGLVLAEKIKRQSPDTAIIFLTGYSQYAVEAFELHVSGYLLKPIRKEKLQAEIDYALSDKRYVPKGKLCVKTFGQFDLFVDDKAVEFKRSKAKELLAYLVDKGGGSVSRTEVFSVLWEDRLYDRPMQKQLDVVIRSLRDTLQEYDAEKILELKGGQLRVRPENFECDLYAFLKGDPQAVNSYRGEYMNSYSWASMTEAYISNYKG